MTAKAIAVCLLVLPAAAAAASGGACLGKVSGALKNGGFESTPQSAMYDYVSAFVLTFLFFFFVLNDYMLTVCARARRPRTLSGVAA